MSNQESDIIVSGSDISPLLSEGDMEFLNSIDGVIRSAIIQSDPGVIFDFGRTLWKDGHIKGLGLAKLLGKTSQQWSVFQMGEVTERFEDAISAEIGISAQTARKYADMWEALFENPSISTQDKKALYGKPIKSLLLLTAAARDEDDINWKAVGEASTVNEVREIVRDARGGKTSSNSSVKIIMSANGEIRAKCGESSAVIGHLSVNEEDPIIKKAIQRIVDRSGILWL
jgi:hypothetical protein